MSSQPRLFCDARVMAGRFRLVRMLGEGGMGVVWEVVDESTGHRRAAKFIRDEDRSEIMVRRLLKEAQAVSAIRHPNVVSVAEVAIDDDGTPVIVMELLEGESLGARLERDGALSVGQTAAILARVVSALRAAHAAGVIHRDLKPDNIFLTLEPNGNVDVRVLDFGIAKHANLPKDSLTVTGTLLGTPLYMSPEQAAGERDLDARSDIWSISVILFECLTGATPVGGDNFGQILTRLITQDVARLSIVRPDLPAALAALVDGGLVPRAQRNVDLAAMEALLVQYADAAIAQPRTVVKSDPRLSLAARHDSDGETVGLPSERRPAVGAPVTQQGSARTVARVAVVTASALLIFVAVGVGWYSVRASTRVAPAASVPAVAPSAAPFAPEVPPDLQALAPSAVPTARATATATATATAAPSGKRSTAPAVSTAPKHGGPPTRLHGGVAGDVPF